MILISFEHLQKILIFPKFQGCDSKIVPPMPFWSLKFKWAWQTQFLSHTPVILKNCVFFIYAQMILVSFFHISAQISVNWKKNWSSISTLGHTLNISSQFLVNLFKVRPKVEMKNQFFPIYWNHNRDVEKWY